MRHVREGSGLGERCRRFERHIKYAPSEMSSVTRVMSFMALAGTTYFAFFFFLSSFSFDSSFALPIATAASRHAACKDFRGLRVRTVVRFGQT